MVGALFGLYFILISITLSKIDNKIWKTKYWNWYLSGFLLSLIWVIFSPLLLVGYFLLSYSPFAILIEASCIDLKRNKKLKKYFIITLILSIVLMLAGYILNIYSIVAYNSKALMLTGLVGVFALILNLVIYMFIWYATYLVASKIYSDKLKAILSWIFFFVWLPFASFTKGINNLKPCEVFSENLNQNKEMEI